MPLKVVTRVAIEKQGDSHLYKATPPDPGDPNLTGEPSAQGSVCKLQSSVHLLPSQLSAPRTKPGLPEHKGLAAKDNQEPGMLGAQRGQQ